MLEDIKAGVARLISLYETEKQRADALATQLDDKEAELLKYKEQITDLNRQIDKLKLAGAFSGNADTAASRQRIDKLIREIDKCIKLLEN